MATKDATAKKHASAESVLAKQQQGCFAILNATAAQAAKISDHRQIKFFIKFFIIFLFFSGLSAKYTFAIVSVSFFIFLFLVYFPII